MKLHMVRYLRELLEATPDSDFNMTTFCNRVRGEHGCRTVGCMAGRFALSAPRHIQNAWIKDDFPNADLRSIKAERRVDLLDNVAEEMATAHLGLSPAEGTRLFVDTGLSLHDITRQDAIKVLKHLEDTHVIDWSIVPSELRGWGFRGKSMKVGHIEP